MVNLRERAEKNLGRTLEGEFGLPVELVTPEGKVVNTDLNGDPLMGQILYDTVRESPDTGMDIISNEPIVVLRKSSLERVPKAGEAWGVRIPITPSATATKENFILSKDRPPSGGNSLGFIRLYPTRNKQKS